MEYKYLILDSKGNAVARGVSDHPPVGSPWRLKIDDGDIERVMRHTYVNLVGNSDQAPAMEGKIVRQQGNWVYLEPVRQLDESVRQNLRMPVRFTSFLYPVSGQWKGRAQIVSRDLSCGGLAFDCPVQLEVGEVVQVVIPVTSQPLLLNMSILRAGPSTEERIFYAGRFLDLMREEESMVREAVFSLQLQKNL